MCVNPTRKKQSNMHNLFSAETIKYAETEKHVENTQFLNGPI